MVTNLPSRRFPFDAARRFTLEEYHRLVEEGILEEQPHSVELLDGRIVPMSPIGPRHSWIVNKLFRAFIAQENGRFETVQDCPLPIPDHDEPEPDLLLCRPGAADGERHTRPADALLVVEVCQSTLAMTLGRKPTSTSAPTSRNIGSSTSSTISCTSSRWPVTATKRRS